MGQNTEVIASNVHFNHFRNWHELINVNLSGKATSTDVDTDMKFASKFQELVKAGIYNNHQPFNVDETSLFWETTLWITYITKDGRITKCP